MDKNPSPVSLLGIPWDASSSFERGAAEAPPLIRAALWSASSNPINERGDDLSSSEVLIDAGDVVLPTDPAEARDAVTVAVKGILASASKPLILGGDHSISFPILRAFTGSPRPLTVLHFDAHADIYDEFEGDRYSHACPFARIMEEQPAARLIQVGIRTLTPHQQAQVSKFRSQVIVAARWRDAVSVAGSLSGPVYVSLDLDVLEPMLAPGISHPEPGGLAVRDVLEILAALRTEVVGADIVEYNPRNDLRDMTARVAAKFVKELTGLMRP